jgi:hypothetical protein
MLEIGTPIPTHKSFPEQLSLGTLLAVAIPRKPNLAGRVLTNKQTNMSHHAEHDYYSTWFNLSAV